MSFWDELAEEDAARLERTRLEIAAEKAAWDALTPEEQAIEIARIEGKFADVPDADEDEEDNDD